MATIGTCCPVPCSLFAIRRFVQMMSLTTDFLPRRKEPRPRIHTRRRGPQENVCTGRAKFMAKAQIPSVKIEQLARLEFSREEDRFHRGTFLSPRIHFRASPPT